MKDQHLRGMAGGRGKACGSALQCGDTLFEHRDGRVHDPRIDVSEHLEIEKRRCLLRVFKDIGRGLIDGSHARPGCRVGLRPGVNRKSVEVKIGHVRLRSRRIVFRAIPHRKSSRARHRRAVLECAHNRLRCWAASASAVPSYNSDRDGSRSECRRW